MESTLYCGFVQVTWPYSGVDPSVPVVNLGVSENLASRGCSELDISRFCQNLNSVQSDPLAGLANLLNWDR